MFISKFVTWMMLQYTIYMKAFMSMAENILKGAEGLISFVVMPALK